LRVAQISRRAIQAQLKAASPRDGFRSASCERFMVAYPVHAHGADGSGCRRVGFFGVRWAAKIARGTDEERL